MKLLVPEHKARWLFAAHLQSALGTGAAYVALLVPAYDRLASAWGATAVLLADLAPAMLLGPLLGRLVDRTSRLGCALAAYRISALAFAGLAVVPGTVPLVVLALLAASGARCCVPPRARSCRPSWPRSARAPRTLCSAPCASSGSSPAPPARPASCSSDRRACSG
jgi:MFS family permease